MLHSAQHLIRAQSGNRRDGDFPRREVVVDEGLVSVLALKFPALFTRPLADGAGGYAERAADFALGAAG